MTGPTAKLRLEEVIRLAESAGDLVFLLRAGDHGDNIHRLHQQAARLSRRYTLGGVECYGVSAFASTEVSEAWVLATKMDMRRRYYRITSADIAGLGLLPTFIAPHWTVMFPGPDGPEYQAFLDALGDLRENPYWKQRVGRRPR